MPKTQPIAPPPRPAQNASPRKYDLFALAILLFVTLPWWLALKCPFILVDDPYYTRQSDVFSGLTAHTFITAFTNTIGNFWLPLTSLSLKLDATLFGTGPLGFHLTNILLHIANTVLAYFFLRLATHKPGRSLLVAALFSMHPLRVESVAWVTERKDVLSGFFGLLALVTYVSYAKSTLPMTRWKWYTFTCLFYILSLLAKPILVTFPFVLLLIDTWPLQRWKHAGWRTLLLEKVPIALCAAAVSAITMLILARDQLLTQTTILPLSSRLANAAISYLLYLRDTFYFQDLAIFYPGLRAYPIPLVAGGILLLVTVTALAIRLCRRAPESGLPLLIGWLWFLGMLVPNIGLVQSGLQSRADRFTYFPSIGLFIALVWLWPDNWFTTSKAKVYATLLGGSAVAVLTLYTALRIELWTDPLALYVSAVAHTENNGWMESFVAKELDERGDLAEAENWYRISLGHAPDMFQTHAHYGELLGRQRRFAEALTQFAAAHALAPQNPDIQRQYDITAALAQAQREAPPQTSPATH